MELWRSDVLKQLQTVVVSAVRWASTSEPQNVQWTSIGIELKESDRGACVLDTPAMTL
jgi:hypothetical protein